MISCAQTTARCSALLQDSGQNYQQSSELFECSSPVCVIPLDSYAHRSLLVYNMLHSSRDNTVSFIAGVVLTEGRGGWGFFRTLSKKPVAETVRSIFGASRQF